MLFQYIN